MSRWVAVAMLVMAISALAVAGLLWAAETAPSGGSYSRCLATCGTLTKYYAAKRATLTSHDGDKQCWSTCDARLNAGRNSDDVQAMEASWATRRPSHLRANQCAQACWRKYHKEPANTAGPPAEPRPVACTPAAVQRAAQEVASR